MELPNLPRNLPVPEGVVVRENGPVGLLFEPVPIENIPVPMENVLKRSSASIGVGYQIVRRRLKTTYELGMGVEKNMFSEPVVFYFVLAKFELSIGKQIREGEGPYFVASGFKRPILYKYKAGSKSGVSCQEDSLTWKDLNTIRMGMSNLVCRTSISLIAEGGTNRVPGASLASAVKKRTIENLSVTSDFSGFHFKPIRKTVEVSSRWTLPFLKQQAQSLVSKAPRKPPSKEENRAKLWWVDYSDENLTLLESQENSIKMVLSHVSPRQTTRGVIQGVSSKHTPPQIGVGKATMGIFSLEYMALGLSIAALLTWWKSNNSKGR